MELGFSEDYIVQALFRAGFYPERRKYLDVPEASGFIGRRFRSVCPNEVYFGTAARGWHLPETVEFRWTDGAAQIPLPRKARKLMVEVVNHCPLWRDVHGVIRSAGRERIVDCRALAPGESRELAFDLEPGEHTCDLVSDPWVPQKVSGTSDVRQLGLAVYNIAFEIAGNANAMLA